MPGFEYLPDQPGEAEPEELLDAGGRRPLPRLVILAGVAIVALAVFTITRNNAASHNQLAAPTASPTLFPSLPVHASPVGLGADSAVEPAINAGPTLDVAIAGETSWVLQPRGLVTIVRHRTQQTVRIPGRPLGIANTAKLVLDVPAGVLWVVSEGSSRGRVLEYDVVRLRLMREWDSIPVISGAAALDGRLYLTSGGRLLDLGSDPALGVVRNVSTILGGVVADPARHRLLMFAYGPNTQVWPILLTARGRPVVGRPAVVALSKPTMGVAEGSVWIAGYVGDRWVLSRLDPRTLQPTTESSLDPVFATHGVDIVADGVVVIWVRDQVDEQLRCIDAVTGEQLQAWMINGAVASGGARALVATTGGAVPLALSACSG